MQSPLGSFLVIWLKEVRVKKRIVRILTINLTIRLKFLTIIRIRLNQRNKKEDSLCSKENLLESKNASFNLLEFDKVLNIYLLNSSHNSADQMARLKRVQRSPPSFLNPHNGARCL